MWDIKSVNEKIKINRQGNRKLKKKREKKSKRERYLYGNMYKSPIENQ